MINILIMSNFYQEFKDEHYREIRSTSILRLAMLGVCVITPAIAPGMSMGYAAVALPQLHLSVHDLSWFASIGSVATPIGNFFTGIIIDKYGRKPTLLLGTVPSIIGWSILAWCNGSLGWLYAGQIFTGFALGAASLPSSIYAAECITINNDHLRGSLITWTTLALSCGTVLVYAIGALLPYQGVALVSSVISILSLLLIAVFIPESPSWLYHRGRMADAWHSQKSLGIRQPLLSKSSKSAAAAADDNGSSKSRGVGSGSTASVRMDCFSGGKLKEHDDDEGYLRKLRRKDIYKPLLLTIALLFCLQSSGVYVLTAYMVNIIKADGVYDIASISSFSPYVLAIISGMLTLIGVILITFIIPYSGIRKLLITSTTGVSIGMFILSTASITADYYSYNDSNCAYSFLVRICAIWLTVFMAGLGFTAIPFSLLGELFPADAKGFACISLITSSMFNFVALKTYPYLALALGPYVFYVYSFFSLMGSLFVMVFLPETVGKSMQEITNEFKNNIPVSRETSGLQYT